MLVALFVSLLLSPSPPLRSVGNVLGSFFEVRGYFSKFGVIFRHGSYFDFLGQFFAFMGVMLLRLTQGVDRAVRSEV